MSLKSRQRAERKRSKLPPCNQLTLQKKTIRTAMIEYLFLLLFIFLVSVIPMFTFKTSPLAVVVIWDLMILGVFIFYLICSVRRLIIFLKIKKIKVSTQQSIVIDCKKISFLVQPIGKHTSDILCVIFKDEKGNKFYYVYPKKKTPSDSEKKHIKAKYLGNRLELNCYKNTNIITVFPQ